MYSVEECFKIIERAGHMINIDRYQSLDGHKMYRTYLSPFFNRDSKIKVVEHRARSIEVSLNMALRKMLEQETEEKRKEILAFLKE